MDRPTQRPLPDNTQHSQQTDISAPADIRTRNPSKRAAADLRLGHRGPRDRLPLTFMGRNIFQNLSFEGNRLLERRSGELKNCEKVY